MEFIRIMKRNSCGKALEIECLARDMMGGNGVSDEVGAPRNLINLEVVTTNVSTHGVYVLILGHGLHGDTGLCLIRNGEVNGWN